MEEEEGGGGRGGEGAQEEEEQEEEEDEEEEEDLIRVISANPNLSTFRRGSYHQSGMLNRWI